VADLDGNGWPDLVVALAGPDGATAEVVWLECEGGGACAVKPAWRGDGAATVASLLASDLDGDGDEDLVASLDGAAGGLVVATNDGLGSFAAELVGASSRRTGDGWPRERGERRERPEAESGPALLEITPSSFDFGTVEVGSPPVSQEFVIRNAGDVAAGPVTVLFAGEPWQGERPIAPAFSVAHDCVGLGPGESCRVVATFDPRRNGPARGALLATAGNAAGDQARAALVGEGRAAAQLAARAQSSGCQSVPTIIPPTTKVLDAQTLHHMVLPPCRWCLESDFCTLVFYGSSQQLRSLEPGDVIVSGVTDQTPHGLMRRVKFLAKYRGLIFVHTGKARLQDAVQQASVCLSMVLPGPSAATGQATDVPPGSASAAGVGVTLPWSVRWGRNPSLEASGQFKTEFDLQIEISWFSLQKFVVSNTTRLDATLMFNASAGASFDWERQLYSHSFAPITIWIGPIPVVIEPEFEIGLEAFGDAHGALSTGVKGYAELVTKAGYEGGSWDASATPSHGWEFIAPTIDAEAKFRAALVPSFHLNFYYLAGPYVALEPYAEFDIAPLRAPWWTATGGLDLKVGVECDLFDLDWNETWPAWTFNIGKGGTVAGTVRLAGAGLPGVWIDIVPTRGGPWSVATWTDGSYALDLNFYQTTVTPNRPGYSFTPASRSYGPAEWHNLSGPDHDYRATGVTHTISGLVKLRSTGDPLAGAVVTLLPEGTTVITGGDGKYSFTVGWGWSGTVSATAVGHTVLTAPYSYTGVSADFVNQDFEAELNHYTITVRINRRAVGAGLAGALVSFVPLGGGTAMGATDRGGGTYEAVVGHGSRWSVAPSMPDFLFDLTSAALADPVTGPQTITFDAFQLFTVHGYVRLAGGGPVDKVAMGFGGIAGPVQTDATGFYTGDVRELTAITLHPVKGTHAFDPDVVVLTVTGDCERNFTAARVFLISGITFDVTSPAFPRPVAGMTVRAEPSGVFGGLPVPEVLSGAPLGTFQFEVPEGWSGTIYVDSLGYGFVPGARHFLSVATDFPGQNFNGYEGKIVVSGRVYANTPTGPVGVPGVVLDYISAGDVTDPAGFYGNVPLGRPLSVLVSPKRPGCTFTPVATPTPPEITLTPTGILYTGLGRSVRNQDYVAVCPTPT